MILILTNTDNNPNEFIVVVTFQDEINSLINSIKNGTTIHYKNCNYYKVVCDYDFMFSKEVYSGKWSRVEDYDETTDAK